jgi:hypothetical protein
MRLYALFGLLTASLVIGVGGAVGMGKWLATDSLPSAPCSSVIENGDFVSDNLQRYQFNGTITFWLNEKMVTIFGVVDILHDKKILRRSLILDPVKYSSNKVVTGQVSQVNISPSDDIGEGKVLFSRKGEALNLIFTRIKPKMYLVTVNDNWITMCEEK